MIQKKVSRWILFHSRLCLFPALSRTLALFSPPFSFLIEKCAFHFFNFCIFLDSFFPLPTIVWLIRFLVKMFTLNIWYFRLFHVHFYSWFSFFFVLLFLSCFITKSTKYTIFGIYLSILVYEAYIKISLLAAFFDSRIFSWKIQCCNFNMKNCWPSKNCKRLHNQIPTIRRRKKWALNASFFRFAAANIIACIFICYRSIFHSYN